MQLSYIVVDLETTGFHPESDDIIEIGAAKVVDGALVDTFEILIQPNRPLSQFITDLTGLTDSDFAEASKLEDALPLFLQFVSGFDLVFHNAKFDLGFLQAALEENGYLGLVNRVMDTVELAQIAFPRAASFSLEYLTEFLGIVNARSHRALSDAISTYELFSRAVNQLSDMPQAVLDLLHQTALTSGWELAEVIGQIRETGFLERQFVPDRHAIIQGLVHQVVEWEPVDDRDIQLAPADLIRGDGPLSKMHPQYEERLGQFRMLEAVEESLAENRHLLVEAGTGTGKSLAYLIPAIYHAAKESTPVVVATHTLHLQEQIKERDLPLLQSIVPFPFSASVLKGRNNYVCMRKVHDGIMQLGMTPEEQERLFYLRMITWLSETDAGDREELQLYEKQTDAWSKVQSDSNSCIARSCPFFKNCYYFKARSKAQTSDVIITNHSLVLTDIKSGSQILPEHEFLVIDEAHHLEDEATKHLGDEVSYFSMLHPLQRLSRDARSGLLASLQHFAQLDANSGNQMFTGLYELASRASQSVQDIRTSVEEFFASVADFVRSNSSDGSFNKLTMRIKPEHVSLNGWEQLKQQAEQLELSLISLRESVRRMEPFCEIIGAEQMIQGLVTDIIGQVKELDRGYDAVSAFIKRAEDPSNSVLWIEAAELGGRLTATLYSAPLYVGALLKKELFDKKSSVILTSATLSIHHSFNYAIDRMGLKEAKEEGRLTAFEVESPFDYKKQSIVCIPTDMVPLKGASSPEYVERLSHSIIKLARITEGRMLVLFTSHLMLKETAQLTQPELTQYGITLYAQGVTGGSRNKLVHEFQKSKRAVLFGTNSFWEGVDIPGEDLSCLVIVRLPFSPPNQPVVEARTESLEKAGKNAFMEYSVPQAVVRFKQGFGRVIRTKKDIGAVVIYDRRVIESRYGRLFLESLPNPWIYQGSEKDVWKVIYNWLKKAPPT